MAVKLNAWLTVCLFESEEGFHSLRGQRFAAHKASVLCITVLCRICLLNAYLCKIFFRISSIVKQGRCKKMESVFRIFALISDNDGTVLL